MFSLLLFVNIGRRQRTPGLKTKDFLSHKSHSWSFIVISAHCAFPPSPTEAMQRGTSRMLTGARGYVKGEGWACLESNGSKPAVPGLELGGEGFCHLSSTLSVNTSTRNVLVMAFRLLRSRSASRNVKESPVLSESMAVPSPNPPLLVSIRLQ